MYFCNLKTILQSVCCAVKKKKTVSDAYAILILIKSILNAPVIKKIKPEWTKTVTKL